MAKGEDAEEKPAGETYKPASTSWGLFERPKNISSSYGGGRNLPREVVSEEIEEKRRRTQARIDQYRKRILQSEDFGAAGTSARDRISRGKELMRQGMLQNAASQFREASDAIPPTSTLGGDALLNLAICLDSMGRHDEARRFYEKLKVHRDFAIAKQAEKFLFVSGKYFFVQGISREPTVSMTNSASQMRWMH